MDAAVNIPSPPPLPNELGSQAFSDSLSGEQFLKLIFQTCAEKGVSDIQLRANQPMYIETHQGMESLAYLGVIPSNSMYKIYVALLNNKEDDSHDFNNHKSSTNHIEEAIENFKATKVDDFACNGIQYGTNGEISGRLRIQAHLSAPGLGITCRILNDEIPELESLGIQPDTIRSLRSGVLKRAGLCLVTGPTGSGKSTTLASLINWARRHHPKHIVTIEDPVEYRYPHDMDDPDVPGMRTLAPSIVTQQEVGRDVSSYRQGLKDVLRKAPHIILLGEIRDREAMDTCLEAAQTGHLVLSTLHTTGAVKTMGRILEMYPKEKHASILNRLGEIMIFIHSQGLLNGIHGRVLNYEFLNNNDDSVGAAVAAYDRGVSALEDAIRRSGNIQWDNNLLRLHQNGLIDQETFENAKLAKSDD
ncbi:type IV pilus twitching motility protein PilT [Rubritalea marina]|uniref:type IV pilus twitching motility protein PilT n=1 Tax=Rubritalea marina TaxID=361055 RepID=UPI0003766960|nr:ATPase, T2SS/T4P/T4SS family [Rubritalea marina]